MNHYQRVEAALAGAKSLVRADGADLELIGVDETERRVDLRLVLVDAHCADCVMPRSILEGIVAGILRRSVPDLARVSIDDPREPMA